MYDICQRMIKYFFRRVHKKERVVGPGHPQRIRHEMPPVEAGAHLAAATSSPASSTPTTRSNRQVVSATNTRWIYATCIGMLEVLAKHGPTYQLSFFVCGRTGMRGKMLEEHGLHVGKIGELLSRVLGRLMDADGEELYLTAREYFEYIRTTCEDAATEDAELARHAKHLSKVAPVLLKFADKAACKAVKAECGCGEAIAAAAAGGMKGAAVQNLEALCRNLRMQSPDDALEKILCLFGNQLDRASLERTFAT